MATKIEKLTELEYNELATLAVIEKDEDLSSIFTDEVSMSFNLVRTLSTEGNLNEDTQKLIKALFDKVILTKASLINKYVQLIEQPETPIVKKPEFESVETTEAVKKGKELPRRYGKSSIEEDIKKQGGKPTNAQLTALAVNDLKNLTTNLNTRLVNDMLTDDHVLSDEDYRDIRSVITIVKNRLRPILKKK